MPQFHRPLRLAIHLLLLTLHVYATQWTITAYAVEDVYTSYLNYPTSSLYKLDTTVYLTNPSPVPTASPYSSTTKVRTYLDATYITLFLRQGAVAQDVIQAETQTASRTTSTYSLFYMDVEYTAPASCPTPFTFTTSRTIDVPRGAEDQVTPTSTYRYGGIYRATVTAYLPPDAVTLSSSTTDFAYRYYIASCTNPSSRFSTSPTSTSTYRSSGGGSSYDYSSRDKCLGSLCPYWLLYVVIFCTLIPLLFLLGLLESYFWFSRLMKGHSALRGVPLCWVVISLWTLLCLRKREKYSPEERVELQKQWREMSLGQKLGLWFQYGFRHKSPPELYRFKHSGQSQHGQAQMLQQPPYYGQQPQMGGGGGAYPPPPALDQQQQQQQQQPYPPQQPYYPPPSSSPSQTNTNSAYYPPPSYPPPQPQQQHNLSTERGLGAEDAAQQQQQVSPASPAQGDEAATGGVAPRDSVQRGPVSPAS